MNAISLRAKLLAAAVIALVGCGGSQKGPQCSTTEKATRPQVAITWHVKHGSMDDDPPRPRVKLAIDGAGTKEEIDLGELVGMCKPSEVGAQLDEPVYGSKVTEIACANGGKSTFVTVFLAAPGKLSIKRWEKTDGGDSLQNVKELRVVDVPSCAVFASEVAQGGDL